MSNWSHAVRISIIAGGVFSATISLANVPTPPASPSASSSVPLWPMVSSLAAVVGIIMTSTLNIISLRSTRLSNSARSVLDLVSLYSSAEFRLHRSRLAATLLGDRERLDIRRDQPVLELFEEIGYMTRRGILDRGMVWNSFFWSMERYYLAITGGNNIIERGRQDAQSKTLYREFEYLVGVLRKQAHLERGCRFYLPPDGAEISDFLRDEQLLISPEDRATLVDQTSCKDEKI